MKKALLICLLAVGYVVPYFGISNAIASPIISVGTGTIPIMFGQVTVYSSVTLTVPIQNLGDTDLNITSIALCSGTSTEYTWSPDAPLTIAPGGSATLSVTYSPVDTTYDYGCLAIASDDPVRPTANLFLYGSGIGTPSPIISLSTGTTGINFGLVTVYSSVTRSVLVWNSGSAELYISSIALCAGTSTEFSWLANGPLALAPGAYMPLLVTYSPINESYDNGCLEIASNDPVKPTVVIALAGSGIVPPPPQPIDIDIASFAVANRVSLLKGTPIVPSLTVNNPGTISSGSGHVTARLTGVQNSNAIYNQTITLNNIASGATVTANFPSYRPTVIGTITWTVVVTDEAPDIDSATATTTVVRNK